MKKKTILVTGAGGFLGKALIGKLLEEGYTVWAVSSQKEKLEKYFGDQLKVFTTIEFLHGNIDFVKVDFLIHSAFARANKGGKAIAEAMVFTQKLFGQAVNAGECSIINISTQEVYGNTDLIRTEESEVNPLSVYGTGKYFSEQILKELAENKQTRFTNIRLAGLIGAGADERAVTKFVKSTIQKEPISIVQGDLIFSQLDIRDAADGLVALIQCPATEWREIYNLGYKKSYSLKEIANEVLIQGEKRGFSNRLVIKDEEAHLIVKLDSSNFYEDTNWLPSHDMASTVSSIYQEVFKG